MTKPHIICHMMMSVDGRIDCDMVAKLKGVDQYYETLNELNTPATLSGRVTAELELALKGKFEPKNNEIFGKENFSKKKSANNYEIIVDTKGTLLWNDDSEYEKPHLIIMSEKVTKDYIEYLDSKNISWIVCGKDKIDLKRAVEILSEQFNIERMSVVGGPAINSSFLENGLLDEVSIVIGLGVDGRKDMPSIFDGFNMDKSVVHLKFKTAKVFETGAVWLRYNIV